MGHSTAGSSPVEYNNDPQFGKASPGKIGMWIFLVTDAMSFSGLLLAYGILRATKDWPNPAEALGGVGFSGFMTFLLVCSSVSMVISIDACKRHDSQSMKNWLLITILGGAVFLGMQVYEYAYLMLERGMHFATFDHGNNLFSSTFYAITGFHGLHVLTGVIYLIVMY